MVFNNNRLKTIQYDYHVSTWQIAKAYSISLAELLSFNDLYYNTTIPANTNIYLQPKRSKSINSKSHQVKKGDTMWKIAQKYGVSLKSLYKRNLMRPGTEPMRGTIIFLKGKVEVPPRIDPNQKSAHPSSPYRYRRGDPGHLHYTKG